MNHDDDEDESYSGCGWVLLSSILSIWLLGAILKHFLN